MKHTAILASVVLLASTAWASTSVRMLEYINSAADRAEFTLGKFSFGRYGTDINAKDRNGTPLLHKAVKNNSFGVLHYLVERLADLNVRDCAEQTALMISVELGNFGMFNELIRHGADIHAVDCNKRTAFMRTVKFNRPEMFYALMGHVDLNATDSSGTTVFMMAVIHGHVDMASALVEYVDIDIRDKQGKTACLLAVENAMNDIFLWLVKMDANLRLADVHGTAPLKLLAEGGISDTYARLYEQEATLDLTSSRKASRTLMEPDSIKRLISLLNFEQSPDLSRRASAALLMLAIQMDYPTVVENLLRRCNSKSMEHAHETLLGVISDYHQLHIFQFLAKYNVKVNMAAGPDAYNFYRWILSIKCFDIISLFADYRVDVESTNFEGLTFLYLALRRQCIWSERLFASLDAETSAFASLDAETSAAKKRMNITLREAVESNDAAVVDLLLRRGADVDGVGELAPLYIAASRGHLKVATVLVKRGAAIHAAINEHSPLIEAVSIGELDIVRLFWEHAPEVVMESAVGGPLYAAAEYDNAKVLRFLLEKGADLTRNLHDYKGFAGVDSEAGRILLSYFDENFQIKVLGLDDAFARAVVYGDGECVYTHFLDSKILHGLARSFALHWAAYKGYAEVVGTILGALTFEKAFTEQNRDGAAGYDGVTDCHGQTPLHIAAQNNHIGVAKMALAHGVSIDCQDVYAQTPLFIAAERGHVDMVAYLRRQGARIDIQAQAGYTPIRIAVLRGHYSVVSVLLEHGADVNEVGTCEIMKDGGVDATVKYTYTYDRSLEKWDSECVYEDAVDARTARNDCIGLNGESLLHLAALMGHSDLVVLFLKNNARIEVGRMGKTIFHIVAARGMCNMMQVLYEHGLDFNVADKQVRTPLHYAVANGKLEAVKLLISWKARTNVIDRYGMSILVTAARSRHDEMMDYITGIGAGSLFPIVSKSAPVPMDVDQTLKTEKKKRASEVASEQPRKH